MLCGLTLRNLQHTLTLPYQNLLHLETSASASLCLCSLFFPVFLLCFQNHRISGSTSTHRHSTPGFFFPHCSSSHVHVVHLLSSSIHLRLESLIGRDGILAQSSVKYSGFFNKMFVKMNLNDGSKTIAFLLL